MTKTGEEAIFLLLEKLAADSKGEARVRRACQRFLRKKTYSGVKATSRKRIPRRWVLEAMDAQLGSCKRCKQALVDRTHNIKDVVGDHIIPLAKGGHHNRWNIAALHRSCNASKGANDPIQESKKTGRTVTEQLQWP